MKKNQQSSTEQQAEEQKQQREAEQARLRKLYLEQQRRLACPGCGESPFLG